jgi:hypothetical protein
VIKTMECGYLYSTAQITFSQTIPGIFTLGKSTSTRREVEQLSQAKIQLEILHVYTSFLVSSLADLLDQPAMSDNLRSQTYHLNTETGHERRGFISRCFDFLFLGINSERPW